MAIGYVLANLSLSSWLVECHRRGGLGEIGVCFSHEEQYELRRINPSADTSPP